MNTRGETRKKGGGGDANGKCRYTGILSRYDLVKTCWIKNGQQRRLKADLEGL